MPFTVLFVPGSTRQSFPPPFYLGAGQFFRRTTQYTWQKPVGACVKLAFYGCTEFHIVIRVQTLL
jgi:hypothetical protein